MSFVPGEVADGVGEGGVLTAFEKQYRFQSLHPTYKLPFAIVGDDQQLEGVW